MPDKRKKRKNRHEVSYVLDDSESTTGSSSPDPTAGPSNSMPTAGPSTSTPTAGPSNPTPTPGPSASKRRASTLNPRAKPSAVFDPVKGRKHTLSIALPGSILVNAQTHEQKNALIGTIARACAVFCVDEIVIFNDGEATIRPPERDGYTAFRNPYYYFCRLLSYLETPPYLRKILFPMHPDFRTAGALPSLDMPHHMKREEWKPFREGATRGPTSNDEGDPETWVECGMEEMLPVPGTLNCSRVTLRMSRKGRGNYTYYAESVDSDTPREEWGYYWGYHTRQANTLGAVFTECPWEGGYDFCIGTSERGTPLSKILGPDSPTPIPPEWNHLLIVFGGVAGLEALLKKSPDLEATGAQKVEDVFDSWVNLVPNQGSRTIRTEEAIWLGLMGLRPVVEARNSIGLAVIELK